MAQNENRKKLIKTAKTLGLFTAFGLLSKGNTLKVDAAVGDNTAFKDISNDVIYLDSETGEEPVFHSGQRAKDLASSVNELKQSFLSALRSIKGTKFYKRLIAKGVFTTEEVTAKKFDDVSLDMEKYISAEPGLVVVKPTTLSSSEQSAGGPSATEHELTFVDASDNTKEDPCFHDSIKLKTLGTKEITENGVVPVLGYDAVKVNVSGVAKNMYIMSKGSNSYATIWRNDETGKNPLKIKCTTWNKGNHPDGLWTYVLWRDFDTGALYVQAQKKMKRIDAYGNESVINPGTQFTLFDSYANSAFSIFLILD